MRIISDDAFPLKVINHTPEKLNELRVINDN